MVPGISEETLVKIYFTLVIKKKLNWAYHSYH